jgi:hypothetical protein
MFGPETIQQKYGHEKIGIGVPSIDLGAVQEA